MYAVWIRELRPGTFGASKLRRGDMGADQVSLCVILNSLDLSAWIKITRSLSLYHHHL